MNIFSEKEKRDNWDFAININQLDGEWIPSEEYMDFVKKEIKGEITTQEIRELLNKKYSSKYLEVIV
ncbi:antitoxin VbhA family protein [Clostridium estertheticum]|uniref:antitoxin VbhA family protein n=1 Tax=Clostridium estertheticum TaxID=238834 RepID=UPI001C7CA64D|nr:antitoxin VbhA family protein [Clostridium estertheticum]MBX4267148.1 antitoxin VbhA family protein [Clostridium estertheticum]MBX4272014.1 antitoxin VbhA family protein [Clostridium estertheticum]WLC82451.1 antitoxin VbhA family protein [Clostridium estertheticum]WLC91271.1 antitoxin VbhA family protein [Clostridium estertheticum]